jgi:hypothetical protein
VLGPHRGLEEDAMVSYFVSYRGTSPDPVGFIERYASAHARVLATFPGIRSLVLHLPAEARDPFPVTPAGRLLLAQMTFDSAAALQAALDSEARVRAREDFRDFPPFEGSVTHQAMAVRKVFG